MSHQLLVYLKTHFCICEYHPQKAVIALSMDEERERSEGFPSLSDSLVDFLGLDFVYHINSSRDPDIPLPLRNL